MKRMTLAGAAILVLGASPALAHTGAEAAGGWAAGFAHPFGGIDHILAMVAVGLLAVRLGGKSNWRIPLTFVGVMLAAGMAANAGLAMPFVEQGILGSIVVLGLVVAFGHRLPAGTALGLVALFAVFHGQAHGAAIPAGATPIVFGLGFAAATAMLHLLGMGLGQGIARSARRMAPAAARVSGAAIALAGLALVVA